jgi:hypothetical protein
VVKVQSVGAQGAVEGLFTGMPKGRMADVVSQGEGFRQFGIQPQRGGQSAGDLGDLQSMGQAAAEVVGDGPSGGRSGQQAGKDLGFPARRRKARA